jgi:hypothetical protein
MKATYLVSTVWILVGIGLIGCSDQGPSPCPPPPPWQEPLSQVYPSWVTEDLFFFENRVPDFAEVDFAISSNDSIRIFSYSISTMESNEVYSFGVRPKGQPLVGKAVWSSPGFSGALLVGDQNGWEELEEPNNWEERYFPSLSPSGTFLVWQSMGDDHEKGIWVYNLEAEDYHFVGSGASPVWHPQLDIVYFTAAIVGQGAVLMIGIGADWETEIVASFPDDVSGANHSFSPNAEFLAFSNPGFPSNDGVWTFEMATSEFEKRLPCEVRGLTWGGGGIVIGTGCPSGEEPGCGRLWQVDTETWESELLVVR